MRRQATTDAHSDAPPGDLALVQEQTLPMSNMLPLPRSTNPRPGDTSETIPGKMEQCANAAEITVLTVNYEFVMRECAPRGDKSIVQTLKER